MAPRSSTDRTESSMRSDCWDSASADLKADQAEAPPATAPLSTETQTRRVSFAPTAKIRQITKLTEAQAKNYWFAPEDFTRMKKSFQPTVQRMMNGILTDSSLDDDDHCIRGLEYRTKDGARRRMKNKFTGMSAVLHEQDRQVFEDCPDEDRLAQVYQQVNAHCMEEAMALGRQDEDDIKEYMASDNEPLYDSSEGSASSSSSLRSRAKSLRSLRKGGSFHERSIRKIKRVFSGKLTRRPRNEAELGAVAVH